MAMLALGRLDAGDHLTTILAPNSKFPQVQPPPHSHLLHPPPLEKGPLASQAGTPQFSPDKVTKR